MILITGDLHGNARGEFNRFTKATLSADYIIILGDFGFIWNKNDSPQESKILNKIDSLGPTFLFIDGNHENHDRLDAMPITEWNGGKVHEIRPHIIHLMRGQVFTIEGHTFATMGGAPSHDIQDGIFDPSDYSCDYEMKKAIKRLEERKGGSQYAMYRIKGKNWWEREIPSDAEWAELYTNLGKYNNKVDYILTHECPSGAVPFVSIFESTEMSYKLQEVYANTEFKTWFFGHYHLDKDINPEMSCLYNSFRVIV